MMQQQTRRDFIATSASLVAASGTRVLAEDNPTDKAIPVVDTHQHLWDLKKFNLPWLKSDGVESLRRSYVTSDYAQATKNANVVKTVYMEVNVRADQQQQEADYVIDLCKRDDNPMVGAVVGGYPHAKSFAAYVTELAHSKYIKGIRTVLHDADRPKGLCLQPDFVNNIKLLGELGRSFDLCMRPGEIIDGARLAERCPKTRFIIDHCGNMSVTSTDTALRKRWQNAMKAAAQHENVVCKISGIVATAKKGVWQASDLAPNMEFCMETFGEDRVFFGGDWPVCTLKATFQQWVTALKTIVKDKSPKFQRKLFHDNAVKFYGLS